MRQGKAMLHNGRGHVLCRLSLFISLAKDTNNQIIDLACEKLAALHVPGVMEAWAYCYCQIKGIGAEFDLFSSPGRN